MYRSKCTAFLFYRSNLRLRRWFRAVINSDLIILASTALPCAGPRVSGQRNVAVDQVVTPRQPDAIVPPKRGDARAGDLGFKEDIF
jgi:hypothetical protein